MGRWPLDSAVVGEEFNSLIGCDELGEVNEDVGAALLVFIFRRQWY